MFIAADNFSSSLPIDVRTLSESLVSQSRIDRGQTEGGVRGATASPLSIAGSALDRWDVQSHQYSTKASVEASILARLISGSGETTVQGIVQEAKRYSVHTTDKKRRVEFGVAVRLSVAFVGAELKTALTLPNIAAEAQISTHRARISLSVDGYTGPLGELLPAPDSLNVENFSMYTTAFKEIQALVFGTDGLNHLSPTLLGYDAPDTEFD